MGFVQLASNRDFTWLWIGETVSEVGNRVALFAYPLVAYGISGSVMSAAAISGSHLAALSLTLLPGGVLTDRCDRRMLLRAASACGVLVYAVLTALTATGMLTVPLLALAAVATGVASGVIEPAQRSAIKSLVSTADLPTALSQDQGRSQLALLAGAPLGGALYAGASWLPFGANALSYAVSWLTAGRIRGDLGADLTPSHSPVRALKEGITFVARWPFGRAITAWSALANLSINALTFGVLLSMVQGGVPAQTIGLVTAAGGIGGVLGVLLAPRVVERMPTGRLAVIASWLLVLTLAPLLWSRSPLVAALSFFVTLLVIVPLNAAVGAYQSAVTPLSLQGRVASAKHFVSLVLMPLAPVTAGALLEWVGIGAAMPALILAVAATALIPTLSAAVRNVPRPDAWEPLRGSEVGEPAT